MSEKGKAIENLKTAEAAVAAATAQRAEAAKQVIDLLLAELGLSIGRPLRVTSGRLRGEYLLTDVELWAGSMTLSLRGKRKKKSGEWGQLERFIGYSESGDVEPLEEPNG